MPFAAAGDGAAGDVIPFAGIDMPVAAGDATVFACDDPRDATAAATAGEVMPSALEATGNETPCSDAAAGKMIGPM